MACAASSWLLLAIQETWVSSLGQKTSGERNGTLQYSCLKTPGTAAWRVTVHGLQSQT